MKVLTAAEMRAVDRRSSTEFGISLTDLMDRAGTAVAKYCLKQYPRVYRVTVLCGKGSNGGDGLVAARVLACTGRLVRVILLGCSVELDGEAMTALQRLRNDTSTVIVDEAVDEAGLKNCAKVLRDAELLIDALVGTGFKAPLRGLAARLREMVEEIDVPVVAVDLPSGWDADSTEQSFAGSFRADAVVTFTAPKLAHVFGHLTSNEKTGGSLGSVVVAQIGSPRAAIVSSAGLSWAGASKALAERPRGINANKGKFGHVLVVGGSCGKSGAPAMASLAALRAGAGLVTAAVPKSVLDSVARIAPELMTVPLAQGTTGAVSFKSLRGGRLDTLLKRITVVALGPGLSTVGDSSAFARQIVEKTTVPVVVDADALNAFEGKAHLLDGSGRMLVLTPHPGEMARLTGLSVEEVETDRLGLARRFATEHKLTLVLKGWRTLVAHPDGRVAVNTSGNPAMAKGGSGDILTGILAAMLAQFPDDTARAVEAAVYLHGLAGDYAVSAMDEHTVLAMDTVTHLSDAFRYRVRDEDGLDWICGLRR